MHNDTKGTLSSKTIVKPRNIKLQCSSQVGQKQLVACVPVEIYVSVEISKARFHFIESENSQIFNSGLCSGLEGSLLSGEAGKNRQKYKF